MGTDFLPLVWSEMVNESCIRRCGIKQISKGLDSEHALRGAAAWGLTR